MRSHYRAIVRALIKTAFAVFAISLTAVATYAAEPQKLQLEVYINDAPINLIGGFTRYPDGRIGTTVSELGELGLKTNTRTFNGEIVMLDDLPSLKYRYDEPTQRIYFQVSDELRQGKTYDLSQSARLASRSDWGALLNYDVLTTTNSASMLMPTTFSGSSLTVEGRAFSPYGTFTQSAILRTIPGYQSEFIRLDSTYRYADQENMLSYVAGDTINGGLAWTRPIRIGGGQLQKSFALRPDLITMPLPSLGGTAAVPSTVDVYVNNIKTFSQDVGTGPFRLNNVPLVTGAGNAQLVIRDAAGRETVSNVPFYASTSLLSPGLSSWSIEAGFPRLAYGSSFDTYASTPVASATLRKGIFDWLTLETHGEGGAGVVNGGAGAAIRVENKGVIGLAGSMSHSQSEIGFQSFVSFETHLLGLNINASSQRTYGVYDDLASATARAQMLTNAQQAQNAFGYYNYAQGLSGAVPYLGQRALFDSARPPLAIDRISFGAPLFFDRKSNLSLSLARVASVIGPENRIVSGTYSRSLPFNAGFFATVFRDIGTTKNTGVFFGLTIPLFDNVSMSAGASTGQGRTTSNVEIIKPLDPQPGSFGWRVRDLEGADSYRSATLGYRSQYGSVQVGANNDRSSTSASLQLRGSIATMGGRVFAADWIDDGFAVVSAGVPDLTVMNENRPVGKTDRNGMLLIPSLRSFQKNRITVDPTNLPLDTDIESTRQTIVPGDRSGVLVEFKPRVEENTALVRFVTADTRAIPVGSAVRLADGREFVVGYDGEAFLNGLSPSNTVQIEYEGKTCQANFAYEPKPGDRVIIGPVLCQ